MEIKINCNAFVSLNKLVELNEINCNINSYQLKDNILSGDTLINGKYTRKEKNKNTDLIENRIVEFEEIVPFTILFNRDNLTINKIDIVDFNYQLDDNSVKCTFQILVIYNEMELEEDEDIIEVPISINNDIDEEQKVLLDNLQEMNDEITELTEELDQKLEDFFDEREDDNNIVINAMNNKKNKFIKNFKNEGTCTISIYYTNSPSDIEKISKKENIGIDKLYDNISEFNDRIIVKK